MWFVFLCCSLGYCIIVLQPSNFYFYCPAFFKKITDSFFSVLSRPRFFHSCNHGQKVLGQFSVSGAFYNSNRSNPNRQQTMLDACIQNFFPVSTLYRVAGWGVGGRENCKKISKRMHSCKREPRHDRKIWILQHCPKDFFPGFWVKATQG